VEERDAAQAPAAPQATPSPPGKPRRVVPWLKRALLATAKWFYANVLVVIAVPWMLGQVFRDRFHVTGLCLFIPSPVVAVLLLVVAGGAWLLTFRRAALGAALLAMAPLIMTLAVENRWWRGSSPGPASPPLRLVNWNIWGGQRGWYPVINQLKAREADIYVLSEAFSDIAVEAFLDSLGPGYSMGRAHSLVVIARGTVHRPKKPRVSGRAYLFHCTIDGKRIAVLVADLPSLPTIHRAPFLRQVRRIAKATEPDIIVGDFNSPRQSLFLSRVGKGYEHAYDLAGAGWSYTWPVPLPLWAIDQCIVGPRLQALRYELVTSTLSDHRMQMLDFALRPQE
jgi:endonuclease/exonuclease/phosphatase (EEP) superfamily protein YafD